MLDLKTIKSVVVNLKIIPVLLGLLLFGSPSWALTAEDLKSSEEYMVVPKILNFDSYIKKGSINIKTLAGNGREIEFIHLEDQGNAVVEFASKFVHDPGQNELKLLRSNTIRYAADGQETMNMKSSANFNIGKDSSGFEVYTALVTGAISNSGLAAAQPAETKPQDHSILTDQSVERWSITEGLSYASIKQTEYNTLYAPISTPFYATADYEELAAIPARPETIRSYIIRGTPQAVTLDNGDQKIYFQWIQCDESLPVLIINACFYFEEATQKLYRYDPSIFVLDNESGQRTGEFRSSADQAQRECGPQSTSYGDFQRMRAGEYDN